MTLPGWIRRSHRPVRRPVAAASAAVALAAISVPMASVPARATTTPLIVIVMENKDYNSIVGNPQAPFINMMIQNGLLEADYSAVMRSSGHDYLGMTSGVTDPTTAHTAPNVFAALGQNLPWREYEESAPSACFKSEFYGTVPDTTGTLYEKIHNPAMVYDDIANTVLCNNVVPLDTANFDPTQLPAFSYVVPNMCNDMEALAGPTGCPMWNGSMNYATSTIGAGDAWLAQFVPLVASSATVVLTWDEGANGTEHVVTVVYGAGVTPGVDATPYDHFGLEAGLYAYFGLGPAPGSGATATTMNIP